MQMIVHSIDKVVGSVYSVFKDWFNESCCEKIN